MPIRKQPGFNASSVPDPKLKMSDPDPQIENQEFRIRIRNTKCKSNIVGGKIDLSETIL